MNRIAKWTRVIQSTNSFLNCSLTVLNINKRELTEGLRHDKGEKGSGIDLAPLPDKSFTLHTCSISCRYLSSLDRCWN